MKSRTTLTVGPAMPTQTWKVAQPVKVDGSWRILRSDGALVGWYATKALAQKAIATAGYID